MNNNNNYIIFNKFLEKNKIILTNISGGITYATFKKNIFSLRWNLPFLNKYIYNVCSMPTMIFCND